MEPPGLHDLTVQPTVYGMHALCRCGRWEGWWRSARSQLVVLDDYDHHRRAEANGGNTPPVQ